MGFYDYDQEPIRHIFEEVYPDAVKFKDVSACEIMYTENAIRMAPDVPDNFGLHEIQEGFLQSIATQDIEPVFTCEEIEILGDFAYVMGISQATITPYDGSRTREVKYRALWVMKREDDQWKIYRQIWNNKPL